MSTHSGQWFILWVSSSTTLHPLHILLPYPLIVLAAQAYHIAPWYMPLLQFVIFIHEWSWFTHILFVFKKWSWCDALLFLFCDSPRVFSLYLFSLLTRKPGGSIRLPILFWLCSSLFLDPILQDFRPPVWPTRFYVVVGHLRTCLSNDCQVSGGLNGDRWAAWNVL